MDSETYRKALMDVRFSNLIVRTVTPPERAVVTKYVEKPTCSICQAELDQYYAANPTAIEQNIKRFRDKYQQDPRTEPPTAAKGARTPFTGTKIIPGTATAFQALVQEMAAKHMWSGMQTRELESGEWEVVFA